MAKLALTTAAAVGLYVPTMGLPLPLDSCLRTAGIANAAPSPTCASDLRECLRQSADMHPATFGVRYVTADDVAKCTEAFNACIHGTLQGNPNPPVSPSSGNTKASSLPQHFSIKHPNGAVTDCQVSGQSLSCKEVLERTDTGMETTDTGEISGTLSGLTMAGTWVRNINSVLHDDSCGTDVQYSGPLTYVFNMDGTVHVSSGQSEHHVTFTGSCSHNPPISNTSDGSDWIADWSATQ